MLLKQATANIGIQTECEIVVDVLNSLSYIIYNAKANSNQNDEIKRVF